MSLTSYRRPLVFCCITALVVSLALPLWMFRSHVSQRYEDEEIKITTFTVAFANIHIIERDEKLIMIDSGYPGHGSKIEELFAKEGYDPKKIDYLILTHGDPDHSGGAAYFQKKYNMKVIGHRGDEPSFALGQTQTHCPTNPVASVIAVINKGMVMPKFNADILIDVEFDLATLGFRGKIFPMPGHTDGSTIILFDNKLFVGDLITAFPFLNRPMTHYYMCDLAQNRTQIAKSLELTEVDTWFLGHADPLLPKEIQSFLDGFKVGAL